MDGIIQINLLQFILIYLLLVVVLIIMKKSNISKSKLLIVASIRMTIQLIIAGLLLTYIFKNPHPLFTVAYILVMTIFACYRVLSKSPNLNTKFKTAIVLSLSGSGIVILTFFLQFIVGISVFNPQYAIPISGMIFGNAMTGITLGLNSFEESLKSKRIQINTLLNLGVTPKKILLPIVNSSLETALLPTINSMLGMGVVSLPGMMTGQILSGTLPTTAILYQISIMIAICTVVCLSVFCSLYFGYKTLYNKQNQIKL